jgi:hypothetical protein
VSSNRGGTVAVVGQNVFSHLFGSAAGDKTGTSMASPQVAGLAMYLWSIAPDLTAPQLRSAMIATARPALPNDEASGCGTDVPSAPRLDAYAAVLSLDRPQALTPASAPVRHAILDRDGDGDFDDEDLEAHALVARDSATDRDFSRSDLNGDGFTGGTGTAPLDLEPIGSARGGAPQLETVNQGIEGVAVEFDETAVTDLEALCFYAYSDLFDESGVDRRATLLEPRERCGAEQRFTNGKLVTTGRSPRGLGQLFPPPRLWFVEPPAAPVPFTPEGEAPVESAWSPDGERIAYARFAEPDPGIWIVGANGQGAARVAGTVLGDQDPTWSPDGTRIAFTRPSGIHVVPAGGGAPALIPGTSGHQSPSWSPDGSLIAASSGFQTGGVRPDIVVFAPDGSGRLQLTSGGVEEEYSPDWSPDGERIVFVSNRQIPGGTVERTRLWIMDADGSDVTQFTAPFGTNTGGTVVEDEHPSWSPDGASIAFARSHQNSSRFVMTKRLDAELAVTVTPLPTNDTDHTFDFPDWQPVPVDDP